MIESPESPKPWHEQYPPLPVDVELFIESERTRMYGEIKGDVFPEDSSEEYIAWLNRVREQSLQDVDMGEFAIFLGLRGLRHYDEFDTKEALRRRGYYDPAYAERCRLYEQMVASAAEFEAWISKVPFADITKLPEPVMVNAFTASILTRERHTKDIVTQRSPRYRQRQ